jgi:Domain of unknown function (DUF4145)
MIKYIPPKRDLDSFNCPFCNAYAHQMWYGAVFARYPNRQNGGYQHEGLIPKLEVKRCAHCDKISIWHEDEMVFPVSSVAPLPHPDMPIDTVIDFNEACEVLARSPRSSAALLRLVIQKLCKHLGQPGKNIDEDIGVLVRKGLSRRIQQALDSVRVFGNNAVHPGQLDLRDDQETALTLFSLVNFIVEEMIARPRQVEEIYNRIPEGARRHIEQRDQTS